jgi:hypothetical protein
MLVVGALVGLVLTACVDQEENATEFCSRNEERFGLDLFDQGIETELATNDDDREFYIENMEDNENSFSKTMKYAEDATKKIRNKARDVDDAYLDVNATYGDSDSDQDDYEEDLAELEKQLGELEELCQEFL